MGSGSSVQYDSWGNEVKVCSHGCSSGHWYWDTRSAYCSSGYMTCNDGNACCHGYYGGHHYFAQVEVYCSGP